MARVREVGDDGAGAGAGLRVRHSAAAPGERQAKARVRQRERAGDAGPDGTDLNPPTLCWSGPGVMGNEP